MICYVVRHGQDDDTVRGGWSNSGLSEQGHLQVTHLVDYIMKHKNDIGIEQLFSSDLPRAVQTVEPIAEALGIEVKWRPEFRETNNGALAGLPNEIADKEFPGLYWNTLEWNEPYPQGESPSQFYERIKTAWSELSASMTRDRKNCILVTHGGVISVIYTLINGTPFSNKAKPEKVQHATLIPICYKDGVWQRLLLYDRINSNAQPHS